MTTLTLVQELPDSLFDQFVGATEQVWQHIEDGLMRRTTTDSLPSLPKMRLDVTQPIIEPTEELAPEALQQHVSDNRIIEILGVPVQKTTRGRLCIRHVRDDGGENDRVLKRQIKGRLHCASLVEHVGVQRNYFRCLEHSIYRILQSNALPFRTLDQN